jgi:hypothetical protein
MAQNEDENTIITCGHAREGRVCGLFGICLERLRETIKLQVRMVDNSTECVSNRLAGRYKCSDLLGR